MTYFILKVWYIGSEFAGSQRQPNKRTVESELIKVLKKCKYITDEKTSLFKCSARTDAGVHSMESFFSFDSSKNIILMEINTFLPDDMGTIAYAVAPPDFKPRFSVISRNYRYLYPKLSYNPEFQMANVKKALKRMEGTHNFTLFSKMNHSKPKNPIVQISKTTLQIQKDHYVFGFTAPMFLWQQIRRMMTMLLDIAFGRKNYDCLEDYFKPENMTHNKIHKIRPAPPGGLILWSSEMPDNIIFHGDQKSLDRMQKNICIIHENLLLRSSAVSTFLNNETKK
jgi:tRNA pseudouridine38-40 synthase